MCGIFGIATRDGEIASELLERAAQSLAHRGPDDSGTILIRDNSCSVGLAHRRLAILDLSDLGHQPMRDPETGNWIVFNGEIYNYRELRDRLAQQGARFRSNCDTEVLLKAYAFWGEGFLPELRGMFSLAIWDATAHRLFMARDPMGVKPFYFATSRDCFLFASEVRSVLETGLVSRKLDPAGLVNYLQFGSVCDPNTLVDGVSALRPGHCLTWENGTVTDRSYWNWPMSDPAPNPAEERLKSQLRMDLEDSIRMQTVSDVPVGVFLSGGIDSTALAAILSRGNQSVSTFSLVFREKEYNEAEYSRLVARQLGTDHHEIVVSVNDAFDSIPGFLDAMDQPTIDGLNTFVISRETRAAGIKVALNGIGGDELFAGYSSFRTVPAMEKIYSICNRVPSQLRAPVVNLCEFVAPKTDQNRKLAELARENGRLIHPYFLSRSLFTQKQRDALLSSGADVTRAYAPLLANADLARKLDPINRVSFLESRHYMLNTLLRDADVMSMAHGLEVRVPLADHKLAESLFALRGTLKVRANTPKPLLVEALNHDLPSDVVYRRKRGFTLPFEHWMRNDLASTVRAGLERLKDGALSSVIEPSAVRRIWADFNKFQTSWSRPWSLYVLQRWCELQRITA